MAAANNNHHRSTGLKPVRLTHRVLTLGQSDLSVAVNTNTKILAECISV